jgi:hypothetical protein
MFEVLPYGKIKLPIAEHFKLSQWPHYAAVEASTWRADFK